MVPVSHVPGGGQNPFWEEFYGMFYPPLSFSTLCTNKCAQPEGCFQSLLSKDWDPNSSKNTIASETLKTLNSLIKEIKAGLLN